MPRFLIILFFEYIMKANDKTDTFINFFKGKTMKKFFLCFAVSLLFVIAGCGGSSTNSTEKPDSDDTVNDEDTADTEPTGDTEPSGDTEQAGDTDSDTTPDNPDTTPEPKPDDDADTTPAPKPDDDSDTTPEPKPDEDADADTTPEQNDDDADSEPEQTDDDADSEPEQTDDDADSEPEPSDDDADSGETQPDEDADTGIIEPTEAEKCAAAHGNWNAGTGKCTKTVDCSNKPGNSEWNGPSSYTQTYADGTWTPNNVATEYSETEGECRFKCAETYYWFNNYCTNGCEGDPCNGNHVVSGRCTPTGAETFYCDCENGYVWSNNACNPLSETSCTLAGGTWQADTNKCTKSWDCNETSPLGEHAVWNGSHFFTQEYTADTGWSGWVSKGYNETPGECHFVCEDNYYPDHTYNPAICRNPCESGGNEWCQSIRHAVEGSCNATDATTYTCDCEDGYVWAPDKPVYDAEKCEPTLETKCTLSGRIWDAEQNKCRKECDYKPENTVWNGSETYVSTYSDEGTWSYVGTVHSDEPGECHYKCAENYYWNDEKCVNPCEEYLSEEIPGGGSYSYTPCNKWFVDEHTDHSCTPTGATTYICGCVEYYEWNAESRTCDLIPCEIDDSFTVSAYDEHFLINRSLHIPRLIDIDNALLDFATDDYDFIFEDHNDMAHALVEDGNLVFHITHYMDQDFNNSLSLYSVVSPEVLESALPNGKISIDAAPQTYVLSFETLYSEEESVTKICTAALNQFAGNDFSTGTGRMQICLGDNRDFSDGEEIRVAIDAKLVSDEAYLNDVFSDFRNALLFDDSEYEWLELNNVCEFRCNKQNTEVKDHVTGRCGCIDGYTWDGNAHKCVEIVNDPCDPNPCVGETNSTEVCTADGENYTCGCIDGYYWDGDSCEPTNATICADLGDGAQWSGDACIKENVPCPEINIAHSGNAEWNMSGVYTQEYDFAAGQWNELEASSYSTTAGICRFKCASGYYWYGSDCVNGCTDDPCSGEDNTVPDSCVSQGSSAYTCECSPNYFWDSSSKSCVNPCDSDPCGENSTCTPTAINDYECGCIENYFRSPLGNCVNPCDENPCGEHFISCTPNSASSYSCECEEGYVWEYTGCKESNDTICNGLGDGATWDAEHNKCIKTFPCEDKPENTIWNGSDFYTQEYNYNSSSWSDPGVTQYRSVPGDCKWICDDGYMLMQGAVGCIDPLLNYCTPDNKTTCIDPETGLFWSDHHFEDNENWETAYESCENLNDGVFDDWHLPTVGQLRTLIQECEPTVLGGSCKVSDTCLSSSISCYYDADCRCEGDYSTGKYNKLGSYVHFWSSSLDADNSDKAWYVHFAYAGFTNSYKTQKAFRICARCKDGTAWNPWTATCVDTSEEIEFDCADTNIEHTVWNDNGANGKFTQTWNGSQWTPAVPETTYNTEPGICRFTCEDGYTWDGEKCMNNCSASSDFPCIDPDTSLIWSSKATGITGENIVSHCYNLYEGNFNHWQAPTISQLRTLVQSGYCVNLELGGSCGVTDTCLDSATCFDTDACKCHSEETNKLGDSGLLSSSADNGNYYSIATAWAYVILSNTLSITDARCVRCANSTAWNGTKCVQ